jgi:hypothetical protein
VAGDAAGQVQAIELAARRWPGPENPENFLADVSSPGLVVRGLGRGRIEEAVPRLYPDQAQHGRTGQPPQVIDIGGIIMSDKPAGTGSGPSQGSLGARFRTSLLATGKTTTGIEVPPELIEQLGAGKRPAVLVTIGSYTYRSTVGVMGGRSLIPVSADNRRQAGIAAGDDIDVALELDTAPRHVELPADLAEALSKDDAARRFFEGLSASQKKWHVQSVESAKTPETRQRRIGKSMEMLRQRQVR